MIETLLIIEDEKLLGTELSRHYRAQGWDVVLTANLAIAKTLLITNRIEPLLILSDMNLPDGNALDFMETMKSHVGYAEWLFLTGYGNVPDSVRALRLGAYDFLEKPCDLERLDLVINSAARSASMQRRVIDQTKQGHRRYSPEAYLGHSQQARSMRELLEKLTQVPFSTLIIGGESGTGKGLVARILHYGGPRAQHPMIEVNCAALPRELLESELFGHEQGAFTGASVRHRGLLEQADGGTLFMDEIGEMPLDLQAKLLKVIEDHKVRRLGSEKEISIDVQIVAASNRDLEKLAQEGLFRTDLYHRLSVFKVILPPLREAVEDLDQLVPLFVAEYNAKAGRQVKDIPEAVWTALKRHDWPGNVRELENIIHRSVLLADSDYITPKDLLLDGVTAAMAPPGELGAEPASDAAPSSLKDMEQKMIFKTLDQTEGNRTHAAKILGISVRTLRNKLNEYKERL
mgnify:CR=1 FL=1